MLRLLQEGSAPPCRRAIKTTTTWTGGGGVENAVLPTLFRSPLPVLLSDAQNRFDCTVMVEMGVLGAPAQGWGGRQRPRGAAAAPRPPQDGGSGWRPSAHSRPLGMPEQLPFASHGYRLGVDNHIHGPPIPSVEGAPLTCGVPRQERQARPAVRQTPPAPTHKQPSEPAQPRGPTFLAVTKVVSYSQRQQDPPG